ncbi:flagellar basal body protein [Extensimonas vulgaris]|uniref:Flagellar basal body rod protein n=1 Tax=Extensimonas vulgaris TaxID=1031594 RepID=A0A369AIH5_9BURK|nr:flagellar basal body protein [Extensimonas vulgaris]RCX09162.1 flagellar basal body rod protein [Extensimonas vulgaris]TWI37745.1 flagellar basal body rod protein [Extensimonas vulgaris]TXD15941.1 flagellar basal body rod protein [Extensimonas vulgaris]
MNALSSTALSGLQAAQLRLDAAASNIANANTPGYRRVSALQQATPDGGVQAQLQRAPQAGAALEQDVVEQLSATYAFKANLRTLQAQQQTLGALLDTQA